MFTDRPKITDSIQFMMDPEDSSNFGEVGARYDTIEKAGDEFLKNIPRHMSDDTDKIGTYTKSTDYFYQTLEYHRSPYVRSFNGLALQVLPGFKLHDVVDVGCAWGITGLTFAMQGTPTTFYDYDGIGLDFLRWAKHDTSVGKNINVVPYGEPIKRHGMCLAFDVLEHTGNHLAALRWFKELGDLVVMCYPTRVPRLEPYKPYGLDEWVDDEAIMWVIQRRYQLVYASLRYEWRAAIFC